LLHLFCKYSSLNNRRQDKTRQDKTRQDKTRQDKTRQDKMENTPVMIGSINDSGFLHGLCRKGFTPPKCLSELVANSIDAAANNVLYNIMQSHIKIIDDGKGMKKEAITNMFDMHKENHAGQKTLGVSGVGGKVSTMILSEKKTVMMYTRSQDGPYYSIIIPWDSMFKEGKYTGMVKMQDMTENEIIDFHKEREHMKNASGVSYVFQYNDKLVEEITKQFVSPNDNIENKSNSQNDDHADDADDNDNYNDIENKLSYIYGDKQFGIDIKYKHYEKEEVKSMNMYDYFGGENNKYYLGKTTEKIKVYEKKNGLRYIWENQNENFEIKKHGKGYAKKPESMTESLIGWKHVGDFNLFVGIRRDENYFNEKNTKMPPNNNVPLEYEKKHFGESKNETLCKPQLFRNGMRICSFELPDFKISSSRADTKVMFRTRHVKCHLTYDPLSNLNNKQDIICGIQDNKNQCDCRLELPFLRLITHIKNKKAEEIWSHFLATVERNNIPPVVVSVSEEVQNEDAANEDLPNEEEVANGGVSDLDVSDEEEVANGGVSDLDVSDEEEVANGGVSDLDVSDEEEVANGGVSDLDVPDEEEVANGGVSDLDVPNEEEVANGGVSDLDVSDEDVPNEEAANEERHTPETEQRQEVTDIYGLDSGLEDDVIDYKKIVEDLQKRFEDLQKQKVIDYKKMVEDLQKLFEDLQK